MGQSTIAISGPVLFLRSTEIVLLEFWQRKGPKYAYMRNSLLCSAAMGFVY